MHRGAECPESEDRLGNTFDYRELPEPEEIISGGRSVYVRRIGEGPRLMILHGGPGLDHHLLLPLAVPLSRWYEVWLPDLPGHGLSHEEWRRLPGLKQMCNEFGKWLAGLETPPEFLCGHSLGAWLAREMVRKGKIAPRATVLISPPAGGRTASTSSVRLRANAASDFRRNGLSSEDDTLTRQELLCFLEQETAGSLDDDLTEAVFLTRLRSPLEYTSLVQQLHRTLLKPTPPCDAGPVLVICGDSDGTTPPRQAEEVAGATRNSRLVILKGAGHFPFGGDTAAVDEIRSFLEERGS